MSLLTRKRPHPASRIPPKFSIIVVVYDMPMQAMNTLYTLSREYQRDVDNVAYEVIVVENLSKRSLRRRQVEALGAEFRYIAREEPGVSPVGALVDGLAKARGEVVGIMVDGARMVTPGILRNVADAYRAFPNAVVATPGFHIGDEDHQHSRDRGHDEEVERELLASIPWKENGYLLYEVSAISGANPWGYLHPMMESNCMFGRREAIERIGWPDPRFDQPGGGVVNLDLYRELVELPESQLIVLPGEASFHQYHGGVTTKADERREAMLDAAFSRVSKELGRAYPELGEEFALTSIELGFLTERRQAFENLAYRVNLDSVKGVVTTMIQTEKYGTPLASALRVLSAEFRNERMMRAEEKAARLPAIMTVPLILFILPVLFIVILGPAACSIADAFSHKPGR